MRKSNLYISYISGLIMAVSPAWLSMKGETLFSANFDSGIFPQGISVSNKSGILPDKDAYKRGYTESGWLIDRVGSKGNVALSPTFYTGDEKAENVLALPPMVIGEDMILRWQACSVYRDFPDSFEVDLYYPASDRHLKLCEETRISGEWITRVLHLPASDEEAVISFICNSSGGYMLAVDDIYVGNPEGEVLVPLRKPEVYYGGGDLTDFDGAAGYASVSCTLLNAGAALENPRFIWRVGEEILDVFDYEGILETGATAEINGQIPVGLNECVGYTLEYMKDTMEPASVMSGQLFASSFRKTLVVDEATGMWCTNCPEGIVEINKLRRTFGDALITLVTHQGDPLEESNYWNSLKFYALPYLKLNRIEATANNNTAKFNDFYFTPANCGIDVKAMTIAEDGSSLDVTVSTAVAEGTDASALGVGYVVTGNFSGNPEWYQKNGCNRVSAEAYYYLPTRIPYNLVKFHDVTLTSDHAFSPLEAEVADKAENGEIKFSIPRPEMLDKWENGRLVVYLMNRATGDIENAAAADIRNQEDNTSVAQMISRNTSLFISKAGEAVVHGCAPGKIRFEVFSASGVRLDMQERNAVSAGERISAALRMLPGINLVRVVTPDKIFTRKILID